MTNLTQEQQAALDHLRSAYVGPEQGDREFLRARPDLHYVIGHLFPKETPVADALEQSDVEADADASADDDVANLRPQEWKPSSLAVSFVTDAPQLKVDVEVATYDREEVDAINGWRRRPWNGAPVRVSEAQPSARLDVDGRTARIDSVWRAHPLGRLVTVSIRNEEPEPPEPADLAASMLFQVALRVRPEGGAILEYVKMAVRLQNDEAEELALRFRSKRLFAVGHGVAVEWDPSDDADRCFEVRTSSLPWDIVPAIQTTSFDAEDPRAETMRLQFLMSVESSTETVLATLGSFVDAYDEWLKAIGLRISALSGPLQPPARRIEHRAAATSARMRAGIDALRDPQVALAFSLAMEAMRLQMMQSATAQGVIDPREPSWRPFQLGFILSALASTIEPSHPDRDLVDLIWFPTGGGKTEAYLGLAAIEVVLRRLRHGDAGGGTAVITRYTMRLLTAQQFQRTALLVCALEQLRTSPTGRLRGLAPFSIGLWVGNETTPGSRKDAIARLKDLYKVDDPREANPFQVEACPWCATPLLPEKRTSDTAAYGPVQHGARVILRCPSANCVFRDGLPMEVVDEDIFEHPPTIVLATVDKFARFQFQARASRILGIDTGFLQPSLVIQDELHLLSGPLGTTVGVFESAILALLEQKGSRPKIVASTATIRSAEEQVGGLYARRVALYPPAGIDEDDNFFSEQDSSGEGRLYVGLMPVSLPQATSLISTITPMFELPFVVTGDDAVPFDSFWTLVAYHNSLRELGRTSNHIVDDVGARLASRATELGLPTREIRADGLIELTSRKKPGELTRDLRRLGTAGSVTSDAVDAVVSSNMLSVGIDVARLGLMLMVGQPKTTSEYIQATSRVGRGQARGVVVTLFRSNRPRDRSHFETFHSYHEALYRAVEPTSVTPWAVNSRHRSLAGAYTMLLRHWSSELRGDASALAFDLGKPHLAALAEGLAERLLAMVEFADADEVEAARLQLVDVAKEWSDRASERRSASEPLRYERTKTDEGLYKRFGQDGRGLTVMDSMRSVDASVPIEVREPGGTFNEAD
ncbi:helicase-related protein [Agrococcus jejuensis]|uniref:Helicase conserved C-terminal domain-containing protein n=1 Tax=Agrococcus jejuensis TaxID=399736 RepID=A0A1G8CHC2_9MICO|nr:helicase-related protein [Agrococcus jejuensis]SDH44320.1 Helicase conserved C-terminal domain-containing protein [Agrococcus jejuensis]